MAKTNTAPPEEALPDPRMPSGILAGVKELPVTEAVAAKEATPKQRRGVLVSDPELQAMHLIAGELEELAPQAQARVMMYLNDRYMRPANNPLLYARMPSPDDYDINDH